MGGLWGLVKIALVCIVLFLIGVLIGWVLLTLLDFEKHEPTPKNWRYVEPEPEY